MRIYVPNAGRATAGCPCAGMIGLDKLTRLAKENGGQQDSQQPKAERAMKVVRNAKIVADFSANSALELAVEHGLNEGHIVHILTAAGATPSANRRQAGLFLSAPI